jgi:ankyrin repeat protein
VPPPLPPDEPEAAFIEAACVPREAHQAGTLEDAETILARHPHVASSSIYAAALVGDEASVRRMLARDPKSAVAKGGTRGWDALTHLCFSRYLRIDRSRSGAFVATARALLDAGASANTGWIEMIDHPNPRPVLEAAIYGAAGIAQHVGLTRLLLERGADPNDEETAYHVGETYDNAVLRILLESGKLNALSMSTLLLRKCDWHDADGLRLVLDHGGDPNRTEFWGHSALHQAVRRDTSLEMVEMLLDHGAEPALPNGHGQSAIMLAARRGRAGALDLFEKHGTPIDLTGTHALIAACARDRRQVIDALTTSEPRLRSELAEAGGSLLAEFSGVGNLAGVRHLLDLGVSVDSAYREGDAYYDIAPNSTALHVAAWRARPDVVNELIARGASVNATDGKGRTALQLAAKACVASHWTDRRSPDSVRALLHAGASRDGIKLPTGYDEIDRLL